MRFEKSLINVLTGNFFAQGVLGVFGLYLIYTLDIESYAKYALYQSCVFLVVGVLSSPFNRIIIVSKNNSIMEWVFRIQVVFLIPFILYSYFYLSEDILLVILFCAASLSLLYFEYLKTRLQKKLLFKLFKKIIVLRSISFVLVCLFFIYLSDPENYIYFIVLSAGISWAIGSVYALKSKYWLENNSLKSRWPCHEDYKYVINQYKMLVLYFIISAVFSQLDFIFLRYLSDSYQVATYGSAFQYYLFLLLVMNSLKQVMLPSLVKAGGGSFKQITKDLMPVYISFTVIVLFLISTSYYWTSFVENGRYTETYLVFSCLAISSILSMVLSPSSEILQVKGKFQFMFNCALLAITLNIVLNYLLIGQYGALGVSVATLISFLLLNSMFTIESRK